jgi:hypothetical protein
MSYSGERLPYPGLRSFWREETDLFFGREGCVDDMVNRLSATRFLAVLGASGSGKSSLVKTGMLDALELGFLSNAGPRWAMAIFAPGEAPLHNLARALLGTVEKDPDERDAQILRSFLSRGPRSVVEWCREGNLPEGKNLLILVDQFEELFRYGRYSEREEAEAFVALLLESARAPLKEARIYVAITMRSEYLGEAALIDGLADAINNGLYLTPRMTRDQVREAVTGPAAVEDFEIEPALVNRLLNDLTYFAPWEETDKDKDSSHQRDRLGRRADQLPLMQHLLNRLWSIAAERGESPIKLTLKDYTDLGGLKGALGSHGRKILEKLSPKGREAAGSVFRALVAGSSLAQAVRNPTRFRELVEIAGDEEGVRDVVETFRAPGRNFLMPPPPAPVLPDTFIDISHESLIRQWDQFAEWLNQEIESSEAWWRLVDASESFEKGEGNLLTGLALASLAHWWDAEQPTAAWAKRYGGDFEKAKAFLEQSKQAEDAQKKAQAQEQRQRARGRIRALAAVLVICIITPLTAFAGYQAYRASQQAAAARQAAEVANAERARADEERQSAQDAAEAAAAARMLAVHESDRARQAEAEAVQLAEDAAEAERIARAAEETAVQANAQQASALRQIQLERIANRAESYQQSGLWESASGLLATFWRDLVESDGDLLEELLIPPIRAAIGRQTLAEYSVVPGFLSYSGLDGSSLDAGRFRVYSTSQTTGDRAENTVSIMDVVTGGAIGSFALPAGKDVAPYSGLLVTPDGGRAALITDDNYFVLWSRDWREPVLVAAPEWMAAADEAIGINLAPVNTGELFVVLVTKDDAPEEVIVIDPVRESIVYQASISGIASSLKADSIGTANLIGTVGDRLLLSVTYTNDDGDTGAHLATMSLTPSKGKGQGSAVELDLAGVVGDPDLTMDDSDKHPAQLTPDGEMLIAVTCSGYCYGDAVRQLVALDAVTSELLWTEDLPPNMEFSENAARRLGDDAETRYATITDHSGIARIFEFGRDAASVTSRDSRVTPWIGGKTFDGQGFYVTLEERSAFNATSSSDGIAEGYLANFIVPEVRQRLQTDDGRQIYVDANSVAIRQQGDTAWIAGVSYDGDLLVYKRSGEGEFALDPSFPSVPIGLSECVAGIAFGGDGKSLLIRRTSDGALRYISASSGKNQMDWFKPASADADRSVQQMEPVDSESAAQADCSTSVDGDDALPTMIAPADTAGRVFSVLDGRQDLWWVRIADSGAADSATSGTNLILEDLSLLRKGVTSVAGDPERERIAVLSPQALEIISATGSGRSSRVQIRSEPRAAVFHSDGGLAVSFAGGRLQWFGEQNGAWSSEREVSAPSPETLLLVASDERVGILDDWDSLVMIERASEGTSSAYSRLPADPIAIALFPDGRKILSVEWVTDSASIMSLDTVPGPDEISASGRLVVMRSYMDRVRDRNIESLAAGRQHGMPADAATEGQSCGIEVAAHLSRLEHRILGDSASMVATNAPECARSGAGERIFQAVDALAALVESGGTAGVFGDENFSIVLQAAAARDAVALRVLGAVLAQMAADGGRISTAAITADAVRFGTGFPPAFLKEVAAGAPIDAEIFNAASEQAGFEPTALQLLAHSDERQINNLQLLAQALFEFSVAERLYRESDRLTEAEFAGQRRVQLARILPHQNVLEVWHRLQAWQPQAEAAEPTAELVQVSADAAERTLADMENAERIDWLPDSLLLESLRTELEHAYLRGIAEENPAEATDRLLLRGRHQAGWSPELLKEYLDLADAIGEDGDAESRFRLAAEALHAVGRAFPEHIHAEVEAVTLFQRAAAIFADVAKGAPQELVASAIEGLDLSLAEYDYGSLPAIEALAEVAAAEEVLGATARIAGAIARSGIDAPHWSRQRGEALFWQGVLTNDHDSAEAAEILEASAAVLRPLVDRDPGNIELRYRYAEALRWQGASMPSGTERADVQRAAIDQYSELWEDRVSLDSGILSGVGTGYGWALTNLGQTLREINIVDVYDERGVEDHAAWMLEVLALSAEEHEVVDTLADRGLFTPDTEFASGLNQMHTFGWSMGFVSGTASFERGSEEVTQCDLQAADPYDAGRRAPAVNVGDLAPEERASVEAICREAHEADADDARTTFQLAAVISYDESRSGEFMPLAKEAAEGGVAAASILIGNTLYNADDVRNGQVYLAAAQQMIIEAFPVLYPALADYVENDRDRRGLAWFAERSAALGLPEAHFALAEAAENDETKRFHFMLAARLWDETGDSSAATRAREAADAVNLDGESASEVAARVAEWTPESRAVIPDDVANI